MILLPKVIHFLNKIKVSLIFTERLEMLRSAHKSMQKILVDEIYTCVCLHIKKC